MSALRPVWAEVDLGAIRDNVAALRSAVAPAELLAVVKADGYGHGAVPVARAATAAGARGLAVALVEEGLELRHAGIDTPVVLLSEPVADAADAVVEHRLTPVVYTPSGIEALAKASALARPDVPLGVHLKIDTGMHRVGCAVDRAVELALQIAQHPELRLAGTCTHFAVADEPDDPYTGEQIARFEGVLGEMRSAGVDPGTLHACNTAAALAFPAARYDLVRVGIGLYGIPPAPAFAGALAWRPALAVKARVTHVKDVPAGARVSYGLRHQAVAPTRIATVPIGYADGVPRNLGHHGAEALVHGRRCRIAGTVTMDQLMLDVGDLSAEAGDEVVLLGRQGDDEIAAGEWARHLGTIAYEIVCGIGPRVPRRYVG